MSWFIVPILLDLDGLTDLSYYILSFPSLQFFLAVHLAGSLLTMIIGSLLGF